MTSKQQRDELLAFLIKQMVNTACGEMSAYHAKRLNETTEIMMRGEATREQVMLNAILSGAFSNAKGSP